jgi:hypothetical protein
MTTQLTSVRCVNVAMRDDPPVVTTINDVHGRFTAGFTYSGLLGDHICPSASSDCLKRLGTHLVVIACELSRCLHATGEPGTCSIAAKP